MGREPVGIGEVRKLGDFYQVKGVVEGRSVSVDIPARTLEAMKHGEGHKLMERGLRSVHYQDRER
jgi:hypothetical protein